MPTTNVAGVDLFHLTEGEGDAIMLISGLSGVGTSWEELIPAFSADHRVVVPDHPGTGRSGAPPETSIAHHAEAMAELLRSLDTGPAHVVGSSTGGAIAQVMALDHPDVVRSIVLASSWARADDYFRHQFRMRRHILTELGSQAYAEFSVLFLHAPTWIADHYEEIEAWCENVGSRASPEVMSARIDMISAHDELDRVGDIAVPTQVVVGGGDVCTPPHLSRQLADGIPGAELEIIEGGHLIHTEAPDEFHSVLASFINRVEENT